MEKQIEDLAEVFKILLSVIVIDIEENTMVIDFWIFVVLLTFIILE